MSPEAGTRGPGTGNRSARRNRFAQWLTSRWYGPRRPPLLLLPLSLLFGTAVAVRRWLYTHGLLRSVRLPVRVVVVGNIAVGGSGKTPVVAWLADELRRRGLRVGIVSRGYGGRGGRRRRRSRRRAPAGNAGARRR